MVLSRNCRDLLHWGMPPLIAIVVVVRLVGYPMKVYLFGKGAACGTLANIGILYLWAPGRVSAKGNN